MMQKLRARLSGHEGATAVEYGIMVALIAVAIIATVYFVGQALDETFDEVKECLEGRGEDATCPAAGENGDAE